jgi:hypothetical protein
MGGPRPQRDDLSEGDVRQAEAHIQAHVRAINDCNQRGGRMLSLVDLIDAGTVDLPLAAYLAAAMRRGASLLVGARPGGAGKTAVMCALLNFLPDQTAIHPIDRPAVLTAAGRDERPGDTCYLAHEIGAGHWYAYVWGREARAFFALAERGHIVVSNLHADTVEETRDQLCRENGVARAHVDAVTLKVYLRMARTGGGSVRRCVSRVYESDGTADRLLWTGDRDNTFGRCETSAFVSREEEYRYAILLDRLLAQDTRRMDDIRRALLRPTP